MWIICWRFFNGLPIGRVLLIASLHITTSSLNLVIGVLTKLGRNETGNDNKVQCVGKNLGSRKITLRVGSMNSMNRGIIANKKRKKIL